MKPKVIFFDNRYVKATAALKERLLPWNLEGKGLFETMRISGGRILLKEEHLQRLLKSLERLGIKNRFTKKKLESWIQETMQKNKMPQGRMRLVVWHDGRLHISISMETYLPFTKEKYRRGFSAKIFYMGKKEAGLTTGIKTIKYQPFLDFYHQAQNFGFDEALLCNRKKHIVEASRSNIFWVKQGVLFTPALKTGCLNGITRQAVIHLAKEKKIPIRHLEASTAQLFSSDEAFFTNSLMGIMPLTRLDERKIAKGQRGMMTDLLQKAYSRLSS